MESSVEFSAYEGRVTVELHAEGDPYGHEGCEGEGCCWSPSAGATMYLDITEAKKLRQDLDEAITRAEAQAK